MLDEVVGVVGVGGRLGPGLRVLSLNKRKNGAKTIVDAALTPTHPHHPHHLTYPLG